MWRKSAISCWGSSIGQTTVVTRKHYLSPNGLVFFYGSRFWPMGLNVLGHQCHLPQHGHSSCDHEGTSFSLRFSSAVFHCNASSALLLLIAFSSFSLRKLELKKSDSSSRNPLQKHATFSTLLLLHWDDESACMTYSSKRFDTKCSVI